MARSSGPVAAVRLGTNIRRNQPQEKVRVDHQAEMAESRHDLIHSEILDEPS